MAFSKEGQLYHTLHQLREPNERLMPIGEAVEGGNDAHAPAHYNSRHSEEAGYRQLSRDGR